MKKICISLLPIIIFANININEFKDIDLDKRYNDKIKLLEKNNIKNKIGDFNNINISSNLDYSSNPNTVIQNNSINIGGINYTLGFDLLNKNIVNHKIVFSKTINEFLYNKFSEADINTLIDKKKLEIEKEKELDEQLNIYKKYILAQMEFDLSDNENLKYKKDLEVLEKNYKIGKISKFDFDVANTQIKLQEAKSILDKENLEVVKFELLEKNLKIENTPLFNNIDTINITDNDILNYVLSNDILLERLNIEKIKISKNKNFAMNTLPNITPNFGYDISKNSFNVGINVNKSFEIFNDSDLEETYKEAVEKEKNLEHTTNRLLAEYKNRYNKLRYAYTSNEVNVKNLTEELTIINKKYEIGTEKFTKIIEKRIELIKAKINLEESKIDLLLFKNKIKRGVVDVKK